MAPPPRTLVECSTILSLCDEKRCDWRLRVEIEREEVIHIESGAGFMTSQAIRAICGPMVLGDASGDEGIIIV